jgi:hypothetical protein
MSGRGGRGRGRGRRTGTLKLLPTSTPLQQAKKSTARQKKRQPSPGPDTFAPRLKLHGGTNPNAALTREIQSMAFYLDANVSVAGINKDALADPAVYVHIGEGSGDPLPDEPGNAGSSTHTPPLVPVTGDSLEQDKSESRYVNVPKEDVPLVYDVETGHKKANFKALFDEYKRCVRIHYPCTLRHDIDFTFSCDATTVGISVLLFAASTVKVSSAIRHSGGTITRLVLSSVRKWPAIYPSLSPFQLCGPSNIRTLQSPPTSVSSASYAPITESLLFQR